MSYLDLCEVGGYMYALVTRNSGTTLEKFDPDLFCDSSLSVEPADGSVSGFGHLVGETVNVRGFYGDYSGSDDAGVTLDQAVVAEDGTVAIRLAGELVEGLSYVEVGIPFTATVEPLPPQIGPRTRLVAATLDLFNTREIVVGGYPLVTRRISDALDAPLPTVSGFYKVPLRGWGPSKTVAITQTAPQPMIVRGIEMESA